jgi:hypothetical protein
MPRDRLRNGIEKRQVRRIDSEIRAALGRYNSVKSVPGTMFRHEAVVGLESMRNGGATMRIIRMLPGRQHLAGCAARLPLALTILAMALLAAGAAAQQPAQPGPRPNAALDARNAQGMTPLIAAASAGQATTVQSLLAQGAGVNATAADGRTALIAATQGGSVEAVRALIAAGANLDWALRDAGMALNIAENKGETEIAALLLAAGAHSTGKSAGDTVCVRPWSGNGFCGTVQSFSVRAVLIKVTAIVGCANVCAAREECSASLPVGGPSGLRAGDSITVPSWCLTETGVKP